MIALRLLSKNKSFVRPLFAAHKRSIVTVIDQATVAYRSTFGMSRVKLQPGIRLNIPIIHKLDRVNMREQAINIRQLFAITKDNVQVEVTGSLFYQVSDPNAALYEIDDYHESVEKIGTSALRSVLGQRDYDTINSTRSELNTLLVSSLGGDVHKWGIVCTKFEIQNITPTSREVSRHLESQMEAERARRRNELETEASINTSEGRKKSVMLEAEAEFFAQKQKADAIAYAIDTESAATARRIKITQEALGTKDSELVARFLIEQSKQIHLSVLAQNAKSSTYFFPENSMLPGAKMMGDLWQNKE